MNYLKQKGFTIIELMIVCILFVLGPLGIAGWVTHVVHTIQNSEWVLLIVGALFFPIGVIHGWGIWFGLF